MFHISVFSSSAHLLSPLLASRLRRAQRCAPKLDGAALEKEKQMADKRWDFIDALPVPDAANEAR